MGKQEPVVFYECNGCQHQYMDHPPSSCDCFVGNGFTKIEYYTAPPKKEWVGLTDREITKIGNLDWDSAYVGIWYDFAKGIEAKLKEKNT